MNRDAFFHPKRKWVIEVSPSISQDEWGVQYHVDRTNNYFSFHHHPLTAVKTLKEYSWPDLEDPRSYGEIVEEINRYGNNYAIMGIATLTLFKRAGQLRGYKEFVSICTRMKLSRKSCWTGFSSLGSSNVGNTWSWG